MVNSQTTQRNREFKKVKTHRTTTEEQHRGERTWAWKRKRDMERLEPMSQQFTVLSSDPVKNCTHRQQTLSLSPPLSLSHALVPSDRISPHVAASECPRKSRAGERVSRRSHSSTDPLEPQVMNEFGSGPGMAL
jgi:hypothetical protein